MMRPNRLHVRLSDEELTRIERLATAHGVTVGVFVREVLARFRSPHEAPGAPLLPALEPEDARARRSIPAAFGPPPAPPPPRPRYPMTILTTAREAAMVEGAAVAEGCSVSEILRRAADSRNERLRGVRRHYGERRDRQFSLRLTKDRAKEIRETAAATGRSAADVILERLAAAFGEKS